MAAGVITVEVVYALSDRAVVKSYALQAPGTVADALALAARDADFRGVDFATAVPGIFGRPVAPTSAVRDGDRIELYRELTVDPKEARRRRVQRARSASRSGRS